MCIYDPCWFVVHKARLYKFWSELLLSMKTSLKDYNTLETFRWVKGERPLYIFKFRTPNLGTYANTSVVFFYFYQSIWPTNHGCFGLQKSWSDAGWYKPTKRICMRGLSACEMRTQWPTLTAMARCLRRTMDRAKLRTANTSVITAAACGTDRRSTIQNSHRCSAELCITIIHNHGGRGGRSADGCC